MNLKLSFFSGSFLELLWFFDCSEVRHLFSQCLPRIKLKRTEEKHFLWPFYGEMG